MMLSATQIDPMQESLFVFFCKALYDYNRFSMLRPQPTYKLFWNRKKVQYLSPQTAASRNSLCNRAVRIAS